MRLSRIFAGALACLALGPAGTPALADGMSVKDGAGASKTVCTKTVSATEHPCHLMEVWDGSTVQPMAGDSSGRPTVNINGTVPVSGTVSVTGVATAAKQPALGTAGTPAADVLSIQGASGMTPLRVGGVVSNPTATFTRPANTTAYAANKLVANSTTAGSVSPFSLTVTASAACSFRVSELVLTTNHTTGLSGASFTARMWSAAPTYANGDGGTYQVSTGAAGFLAKFSGPCEQFDDGAVCVLTAETGFSKPIKLASGTTVAVDLMTPTGFTPQSGKTFTLRGLVEQDAC